MAKDVSCSSLPLHESLGRPADRRSCQKDHEYLLWLLSRYGKSLYHNFCWSPEDVVFQALLRHAIASSSVALECWKFLQAYFNDVLEQHGGHTDPQSLILIPRHGQWETVDGKLLNMSETTLGDLTEEMNTHARCLVSFVSQMANHSPLPREDPR